MKTYIVLTRKERSVARCDTVCERRYFSKLEVEFFYHRHTEDLLYTRWRGTGSVLPTLLPDPVPRQRVEVV